jgi:hypothetical protein
MMLAWGVGGRLLLGGGGGGGIEAAEGGGGSVMVDGFLGVVARVKLGKNTF